MGELLSGYLDGQLSSAEERKVSEHLRSCDECVTELRELHEARSWVRSLRMLELPAGFAREGGERTTEVIALYRRPRAWAAAAAAALVLLVGLATALAPSPASIQVPIDDLSNQFRARESLERTFTPIDVVPVILERTE